MEEDFSSPLDGLSPEELVRFLEEEARALRRMHTRVGHQLHRLQVEEHFLSKEVECPAPSRYDSPDVQIQGLEEESTMVCQSNQRPAVPIPRLRYNPPDNSSGDVQGMSGMTEVEKDDIVFGLQDEFSEEDVSSILKDSAGMVATAATATEVVAHSSDL